MHSSQILVAAVFASCLATACCSERHEHAPRATVAEGGAVSVAPFDSIDLRGGGHVTLRYGAEQRVTLIKGSAEITRFSIEDGHKLSIDRCESDCPSDYDLDVEIVTPRLQGVGIEGGGKIVSEAGFPAQGELAVGVEGGGAIDLRTIDAATVQAAVSGGGRINVHADQHLTAAVNGGGSIRYSGNAEVTTAVNGGGSIQPESGD